MRRTSRARARRCSTGNSIRLEASLKAAGEREKLVLPPLPAPATAATAARRFWTCWSCLWRGGPVITATSTAASHRLAVQGRPGWAWITTWWRRIIWVFARKKSWNKEKSQENPWKFPFVSDRILSDILQYNALLGSATRAQGRFTGGNKQHECQERCRKQREEHRSS